MTPRFLPESWSRWRRSLSSPAYAAVFINGRSLCIRRASWLVANEVPFR